ncbi:MAG TPA: ATP-binding protein [Nitrospiria bacterium]|jgi:signal transduction histidine kinase|nr:ATP-binding protein [Nitrospiria bacterium]
MIEGLDYKKYPALYVDDEEMALETFKAQFRRDFTIHTALSGEEALRILSQQPIALIITDQRMPQMGGVALLEEVTKQYPNTIRMLMTAYSDMDIVIAAINKGQVYRYFPKPYNEDELRESIKEGLERYYLIRERERLYAEKIELIKRMERTNRLTAVGTLAAGMAHEINNPLVAINTFLQMVPQKYAEEEMDKEFWEHFHKVVISEVDRIRNLIGRLLKYSRFSEKEELHLEETDINQILQDMATFLDNEAKRKGLTIQQDLTSGMPTALLDRERMKQVFLNILLNAIQATFRGYIRIKSACIEEDGEKFLQIAISDTGIGISEEELQKLFNPFFTTKQRGGSGLGLITCHQIVDEHRGTIDVQTEVGKGSTFIVTLPLDLRRYNRRRIERRREEDRLI